jgi:hypothetical protein
MYKSWYNKPREMQLQSLTALIYFAHTIVQSQAQCSLGYFTQKKDAIHVLQVNTTLLLHQEELLHVSRVPSARPPLQ